MLSLSVIRSVLISDRALTLPRLVTLTFDRLMRSATQPSPLKDRSLCLQPLLSSISSFGWFLDQCHASCTVSGLHFSVLLLVFLARWSFFFSVSGGQCSPIHLDEPSGDVVCSCLTDCLSSCRPARRFIQLPTCLDTLTRRIQPQAVGRHGNPCFCPPGSF